jgi:hypothetical protein
MCTGTVTPAFILDIPIGSYSYDQEVLIYAIQGIVNRASPLLIVNRYSLASKDSIFFSQLIVDNSLVPFFDIIMVEWIAVLHCSGAIRRRTVIGSNIFLPKKVPASVF